MATLNRLSVKADNSCLFTSIVRLCEDISSEIALKSAARRLRGVCADAVMSDPDPATRAILLGHDSIDDYSRWIRDEHHWGGEPEVLMLASHFGVEVVICSCEALNFLRYAPEAAAAPAAPTAKRGRIYLLYTGQHYDPLVGADGTLVFPEDGGDTDALESSALSIAKEHNEAAARRAKEKRVNRLKCSGCGAILADAAAFQEHCGSVEHDDDFTYDCEQVEVVIGADEELPEGSVDLNAPDVHAFYNVQGADAVSLSMRCAVAPFELHGKRYESLEVAWRAFESEETVERRRALLEEAISAQYRTDVALSSGLREHLLSTHPKTIVCVDIDPWLGMQAAGGISAGQNGMGRALMATREELLSERGGSST